MNYWRRRQRKPVAQLVLLVCAHHCGTNNAWQKHRRGSRHRRRRCRSGYNLTLHPPAPWASPLQGPRQRSPSAREPNASLDFFLFCVRPRRAQASPVIARRKGRVGGRRPPVGCRGAGLRQKLSTCYSMGLPCLFASDTTMARK